MQKLAYTDLWGFMSHPQFSEKLVKELDELKAKCYSQKMFEKERAKYLDNLNKKVTDEFNACIQSAERACKESVSHKRIAFAPVETSEFIMIQNAPTIRSNFSCRNRFLAIIHLEFDKHYNNFIINTQSLKPAYSHYWNSVMIGTDGNFYPIDWVNEVYLIYRLADQSVKNWRIYG